VFAGLIGAVLFGVGCADSTPSPAASAKTGGAIGYVRLVNLTPATLDASIEGRPLPAVQSGRATPYARMPAPLAKVAVAAGDRLWGGLAIFPQEDIAKSLYLLSERVRVPVSNEPVDAPVGSAAVQGVNCCRQAVRFELKPAKAGNPASTSVKVAPMAYKRATKVKPGLYDVVAFTQDGRKASQRMELADGCGYSAVAYMVGDKPKIALIQNTLAEARKETDAHRCGPVMA
jgi:hypothetical protein